MNKFLFLLFFVTTLFFNSFVYSQIPSVYKNIFKDQQNKIYFLNDTQKIYLYEKQPAFTLRNIMGNPTAYNEGINFDFNDTNFSGTLHYGLIDFENLTFPNVLFFRKSASIKGGKTKINILELGGVYDISNWKTKGYGSIGYRIQNNKGDFLYEGIINFTYNGTIGLDATIVEGPFLGDVKNNSIIIWYKTDIPVITTLEVNNKKITDKQPVVYHEFLVNDLVADSVYNYTLYCGKNIQKYSFKTAPAANSKKSFVFAFGSDSRSGRGGGERDFNGVNFYVMRKIAALCMLQKCDFMQFTGDLVSGYVTDTSDIQIQYANWKRSIQPFAPYLPIYTTVGNHEIVMNQFIDSVKKTSYRINKFPFNKTGMEVVFAANFVNPTNGPVSEDGSKLDPNPANTDFPPYSETVYHYNYGNAAMIVLNSNYLFAPEVGDDAKIGGNLHGYVMENQLKWLEQTLNQYENNKNIDHIFVTIHTPLFPNGGHSGDCMWYNGDNKYRPVIAGKKADLGIIENRDRILDLLVNKSKKTVAVFVGDEHNYSRLAIGKDMPMYPDNYDKPKINLSRTIYQITNGASGAPYYAREQFLWTGNLCKLSTQYAIVFITVNGKTVSLKVINPDTFEIIEQTILKE